jgi:hypothetical protein
MQTYRIYNYVYDSTNYHMPSFEYFLVNAIKQQVEINFMRRSCCKNEYHLKKSFPLLGKSIATQHLLTQHAARSEVVHTLPCWYYAQYEIKNACGITYITKIHKNASFVSDIMGREMRYVRTSCCCWIENELKLWL